MKRSALFICLLALLSVVSGIMMSHARWIARVGITFFHKEYNFTKIWWQGATAVFVLLIALFLIHYIIRKQLGHVAARMMHFLLLLAAAGGLYLTYDDFATDFSHHLLGWRFHYGFYLFWIGWMLICIYFLFSRKTNITGQGKTGTTTL